MSSRILSRTALFLGAMVAATTVGAWDAEGHHMVNQAALAALPADFPAFVRTKTNADRIVYLAAEPDRWSHSADLTLKHDNWPDHYLDIEDLTDAGMDPERIPSMRYDFVVAFAQARAAHAANFPPIDPAKNTDRTRELSGFLPWAIAEYFGKLQAAFGSLAAYRNGGTETEISNAEEDVVYIMGIMGHYVGDGAQPLHTTSKFNGWVGPNPNGYTTWTGFHSWIDSGFIIKAGMKFPDFASRVKPARLIATAPRPDGRDPLFAVVMDYLIGQNRLVEPLYRMEKDGKMNRDNLSPNAETRAFIEAQLLKGGDMLACLWYTAWRTAPVDSYLAGQIAKRQGTATPSASEKRTAP